MKSTTTLPEPTLLAPPVIEAAPEAPPVPQRRVTSILPLAAVELDAEIRAAFLSEDLEVICDCAGKSKSAVLIATAGQGLEQREAAFLVWRRAHLGILYTAVPCIGEYFSSPDCDVDLREQFKDGTVDLYALDRAIHDARHEKGAAQMALLAAQKDTLRAALYSNCLNLAHPTFPQMLVVRGDGEMKLVKNGTQAKEFGRAGNFGFYLLPLSHADYRRFLPE
jgi:hypothetical protein